MGGGDNDCLTNDQETIYHLGNRRVDSREPKDLFNLKLTTTNRTVYVSVKFINWLVTFALSTWMYLRCVQHFGSQLRPVLFIDQYYVLYIYNKKTLWKKTRIERSIVLSWWSLWPVIRSNIHANTRESINVYVCVCMHHILRCGDGREERVSPLLRYSLIKGASYPNVVQMNVSYSEWTLKRRRITALILMGLFYIYFAG